MLDSKFCCQSLRDRLASRGVRITAQRKAVVAAFETTGGRLDAVTLLEKAREHNDHIDRATVYRTLQLLKRFHLVDGLHLIHSNGDDRVYETKPDRDKIQLACFECGRIQEFECAKFQNLKDEVSRRTGFQVRIVRLEAGGRCRICCAGAAGLGCSSGSAGCKSTGP